MKKFIIIILVMSALQVFNVQAATLSVDAKANIFGAGHSTTPATPVGSGGMLPPSFTFSSGQNQVLTFSSVSGNATLSPGWGPPSPDGYFIWASNIYSIGGISGITHDGAGFLVGVFLGSTEKVDPAPSALDFRSSTLGTSFESLSPVIGQTFFIGDGLTGTGSGSVQQFIVPTDATRLFLGFADAHQYKGYPGQYTDNSGSFVATFSIAPEPISSILFVIGGATLIGRKYIRRKK